MSHEVTLENVTARHVAAVRDRRPWTELGPKLIPLLDRVYVAVRAGQVVQPGQNLFIFRDGSDDEVTVEIGVEIASPLRAVDGIVSTTTLAGEVARTLHTGPYSGLRDAHQAVRRFIREHGRRHANVWWEVYGHWQNDPAKLETEVFHAVLPA
ncbi:MAG TPA: GyrI-like domain-containing protein [Candidatus Polarisedimenticolaceae bacterium]|nr:GyrI-like domain-containing protein [Candidatus Polarisedimenticolaceae bacterium]